MYVYVLPPNRFSNGQVTGMEVCPKLAAAATNNRCQGDLNPHDAGRTHMPRGMLRDKMGGARMGMNPCARVSKRSGCQTVLSLVCPPFHETMRRIRTHRCIFSDCVPHCSSHHQLQGVSAVGQRVPTEPKGTQYMYVKRKTTQMA